MTISLTAGYVAGEKISARFCTLLCAFLCVGVTLTSCGEDQTVAPKNTQYSATTARNTAKQSNGKTGKVSGEDDAINANKPNAKPSDNKPSIATENSTTSAPGSSSSSSTPAASTTTTTPAATYEAGQAFRLREDADMDIRIDLMGDNGAVVRSVTLRDPDERSSQQLPEMCRKGGTTKWKISFIKNRTKSKGDSCYFVVSNSGAKVRLDVDMVGDEDGCKPGEDDQFEFSCQNGTIELL